MLRPLLKYLINILLTKLDEGLGGDTKLSIKFAWPCVRNDEDPEEG